MAAAELVEIGATVVTTAITSTGLTLAFVRGVVTKALEPLVARVLQLEINEERAERKLRRIEQGVFGNA